MIVKVRLWKSRYGFNNNSIDKTHFKEFHNILLYSGVQVYGEGNWGRILDAYQHKFHASRTNISIKDRWRTMLKNGIDKQLSREQREKAKK